MDETRRMELVDELRTIARTGGADTTSAIKTIAGALAEALGPTSHERAVAEEIRKHGTKTAETREVAPDPAAMAAARGEQLAQDIRDEVAKDQGTQQLDARAHAGDGEGAAREAGAGEDQGKQEPATT